MTIQTAARWVASMAAVVGCAAQCRAVAVPGNWSPTWADEFNVGNGDLSGFSYDLGGGGWGNNESEVYTRNAQNVSVSNGSLHLTAIATGTGANASYTSARVKTSGLFSQAYGLFEFRAKMPSGQGLWPALWMMPQNSAYGSWPTSGEIDVFESQGQSPTLVQGSLHSGPSWDQNNTQTKTLAQSGTLPVGFSTTDWHTYDLQWDKGSNGHPATFKWYVDGSVYYTQQGGWTLPAGAGSSDAPFNQPFYLIMNLAVGGDYAGSPNLAPGSYDMQVDYVRAYAAVVPEPTASVLAGFACLAMMRRTRRGS